MKNFKKIFEEKLAKAKEIAEDSPLYGELAVRMISNERLTEIRNKVKAITGRDAWIDYSWNTGEITGLLRSVFFEKNYRDKIYEETPITKAIMDEYYRSVGNFPYCTKDIDPATGKYIVNEGRPMNIERTKQLIMVVASLFGVLVEESDLDDINEERIKYLYSTKLKQAQDTAETAEPAVVYPE